MERLGKIYFLKILYFSFFLFIFVQRESKEYLYKTLIGVFKFEDNSIEN